MRKFAQTSLFIFICLFIGSGLQAQENAVLANGNIIINGFEYAGENYREMYNMSESALKLFGDCSDCQPNELVLPIVDTCGCKQELCPGLAIPQFLDFGALDPNLEILRINVFKLTFCQSGNFDLIEVHGVPTNDGIVYGRLGLMMVAQDYILKPDNFYIIELIVRNTQDDCPGNFRHHLVESFYVGTCCPDTSGVVDTTIVVNAIQLNICAELDAAAANLSTTSAGQVLEDIDLGLAPNPTNGMVYLNFEGNSNSFEGLTVFSSLGQEVLNFDSDVTEIDLSLLPSGTYMFKFRLEGATVTKQIIKID
jgi:hypothetical protein